MSLPPLNERAQQLLKALIERYISEGVPVGSRTLSQATPFSLSPATIRNVMADLETMGLIHAPHTSAGRVPTIQGYRLFINQLLTMRSLDEAQVDFLSGELRQASSSRQQLIETASQLLSHLTRYAGLVTLPRREHARLTQIEFVPLSGRRVLAILVMDDGEVQNRVLPVSRDYSSSELRKYSALLSEQLAGQEAARVREALLAEMDKVRSDLNTLMLEAIQLTEQALDAATPEPDLVISGQANLVGLEDMGNLARMKRLFEAFETKRDILHLLDQSERAEGVQIFIGGESGYDPFEGCSLITAPYREQGRVVGYLGVIGPTRMPYDRVIPLVDITARLLGAAMSPGLETEG
ncbi:MAG: heat-inducible transcriptional repressor HrcA [Pseudomonadota bacterium]|jgi:heat-inducible transcriptional repressor